MTINYTDKSWCLRIPDTRRKWEALILLFNSIGVDICDTTYEGSWRYLSPNQIGGDGLSRHNMTHLRKVSLIEAVARLTTPAKSATELKIEQLEKTIAEASAQIQDLKVSHAK
tara:strand:- start:39176 stop:39514 length:339 start_codon:yes stop_codon:yes gene_type:complete